MAACSGISNAVPAGTCTASKYYSGTDNCVGMYCRCGNGYRLDGGSCVQQASLTCPINVTLYSGATETIYLCDDNKIYSDDSCNTLHTGLPAVSGGHSYMDPKDGVMCADSNGNFVSFTEEPDCYDCGNWGYE